MIANFLSKVKDPRKKRGKRYSLGAVLRLIVAGLLANRNSMASIARYGKSLKKKTLRALGFYRGKSLCHSNLTIIIRKISPDDLFNGIVEVVNSIASGNEKFKKLHLDGKTLRGSNTFGKKKHSQILTAFNKHFQSVIGFKEIIEKDENAAYLAALKSTDIKDKIVTGDAAFAHEKICETVIDQGGNFALSLKGNEGNLHYHTQQKFEQLDQAIKNNEIVGMRSFTEEIDSLHGRIEQRHIDVIDMPWEYLNGHRYIKQICRITRYREYKNKENSRTEEVAYMITSLEKEVANPQKLLEINRMHWSCENNLNWVKDQIFMEDKSTISMDNGPIVASLLRSFAISIIATVSNKITETREMFSMNERKLLSVFAELGCKT
jgi:hypothetical protein